MNLNVGSSIVKGAYRSDEWINLDLFARKRVNVRGDGCVLPFKDSSFEVVHAAHILEHLTRDKIPLMVKELGRVTKSECLIEVPNFESLVTLLYRELNGKRDSSVLHRWRTSVYGKNEVSGMAHHHGFLNGELEQLMLNSGFDEAKQLTDKKDMITPHWKLEPVILVRGRKTR